MDQDTTIKRCNNTFHFTSIFSRTFPNAMVCRCACQNARDVATVLPDENSRVPSPIVHIYHGHTVAIYQQVSTFCGGGRSSRPVPSLNPRTVAEDLQVYLGRRVTLTLISWAPKLMVLSPCIVDDLCQFSSESVHSFSKHFFTRLVTDGQTDRQHDVNTCQSGLAVHKKTKHRR